jgi:hypothetical protein
MKKYHRATEPISPCAARLATTRAEDDIDVLLKAVEVD